MKVHNGVDSPYRQFGCFFEKNIKKYLATQKTISFYCGDASGTSQHPLYQISKSFTYNFYNPDVEFEEPTAEEYCEWYYKKYGKGKNEKI